MDKTPKLCTHIIISAAACLVAAGIFMAYSMQAAGAWAAYQYTGGRLFGVAPATLASLLFLLMSVSLLWDACKQARKLLAANRRPRFMAAIVALGAAYIIIWFVYFRFLFKEIYIEDGQLTFYTGFMSGSGPYLRQIYAALGLFLVGLLILSTGMKKPRSRDLFE